MVHIVSGEAKIEKVEEMRVNYCYGNYYVIDHNSEQKAADSDDYTVVVVLVADIDSID